jgi:hypothetical protein
MLARLEREVPARYAHQRGRRRLVMVGAGAVGLLWAATAVAWVLAPSDTAMFVCFGLFGLAAVAGAGVGGALSLSTRGIIGLPPHLLDEWQSKQRLHAHAKAHQLTLLLLFVTYFVVILALPDDAANANVPNAALTILFLSLVATVATLPSLVVAWRMPDPPADDEDEQP